MNKENTSGYKLKPMYEGIPLEFGSQIHVTSKSITKKQAELLIKNHPRGEELFAEIPQKQKVKKAPKKESSQQAESSTNE